MEHSSLLPPRTNSPKISWNRSIIGPIRSDTDASIAPVIIGTAMLASRTACAIADWTAQPIRAAVDVVLGTAVLAICATHGLGQGAAAVRVRARIRQAARVLGWAL